MFLKTLDLQHQSRQRQEIEPLFLLLKTCQGLLMLSWLWDPPRLLWPSPLAMEVSLAWRCWSGPACAIPLVDSGAAVSQQTDTAGRSQKCQQLKPIPKITGTDVAC